MLSFPFDALRDAIKHETTTQISFGSFFDHGLRLLIDLGCLLFALHLFDIWPGGNNPAGVKDVIVGALEVCLPNLEDVSMRRKTFESGVKACGLRIHSIVVVRHAVFFFVVPIFLSIFSNFFGVFSIRIYPISDVFVGCKLGEGLKIGDRRMAVEHDCLQDLGRIFPQSVFNKLKDLAGPDEVVCGMWIGFVVCIAVIEGSEMEDKAVLDHSRQAMMQLAIGQASVEFKSRKCESLITVEYSEDALRKVD